MERTQLKILVAEDEALVRQGLAALLELEAGEVTEAADGEEAIRRLVAEPFDIALVDIGLPKRTGLDILREVRLRQLPVKIIVLTGDTASYSPSDIYEAGADGFVYKTADADKLLEIVNGVAKGRDMRDRHIEEGENARSMAELKESLTQRELEIVKLVVEGASNREAADVLGISEHTVRKHREHINSKLHVGSPAALASFAIKAGLI